MKMCEFCNTTYTVKDSSHWKRYKYCSKSCSDKGKIGKKRKPFSVETRRKMSEYAKTRKYSLKTRLKMRIAKIGPRAPKWIDGRSYSIEYKNWVKNRNKHLRRIMRNNGLTHDFTEWESLKEKYSLTCPCCFRKEPEIKLSIDHIIPLSKGGTDLIENIQPLCLGCNIKKHTKTIKYNLCLD